MGFTVRGKMMIKVLGLVLLGGCTTLSTVSVTTKIIYVDSKNMFVVFDKGKRAGMQADTKVCIVSPKDAKKVLYCGPILPPLESVSAYSIPAEVIAEVAVGTNAFYNIASRKQIEPQTTQESRAKGGKLPRKVPGGENSRQSTEPETQKAEESGAGSTKNQLRELRIKLAEARASKETTSPKETTTPEEKKENAEASTSSLEANVQTPAKPGPSLYEKFTEVWRSLPVRDRDRGISAGLLITPKSPVSGRSLYFLPPVKRTQGVNSSLWQPKDQQDQSGSGLFLSYTGQPRSKFSLRYDSYLRFFSPIINEQNDIPGDPDSYVSSTFRQSAMGLGVGVGFKQISIAKVNFTSSLFVNMERSVITFDAKEYGTDTSHKLISAKSELYALLLKPEIEMNYSSNRYDYGLSYGIFVPIFSSLKNSGTADMPATNDIVVYDSSTSRSVRSDLNHKSSSGGHEIRLIFKYKLKSK